ALLGHVARNNDQWRHATGGEALVIVHGTDHYVSPSWLPSAAQGTVVPTWDYVTLHVYGSLVAHDDPEWTGTVVRRLTERHESTVAHPWTVEGAKPGYVEAMMRAIVGLELKVTRVEAKAKMAQNKTPEDVAALAGALQAGGDLEGAAFLREVSLPAAVRRAQTLADVAAGRHHRTPAGT
ncbi:MAG TPA: FMN-binding negative transcriptional regulator, partial [Candidatus Lustribacter sp.]|nr:FMN-binding negative transcriptional regulator [Candidatus Lustribacter sp.]